MSTLQSFWMSQELMLHRCTSHKGACDKKNGQSWETYLDSLWVRETTHILSFFLWCLSNHCKNIIWSNIYSCWGGSYTHELTQQTVVANASCIACMAACMLPGQLPGQFMDTNIVSYYIRRWRITRFHGGPQQYDAMLAHDILILL